MKFEAAANPSEKLSELQGFSGGALDLAGGLTVRPYLSSWDLQVDSCSSVRSESASQVEA